MCFLLILLYPNSFAIIEKTDREGILKKDNAGNSINRRLNAVGAYIKWSKDAKLAGRNRVLMPTLMYRSDSWNWQRKDERKLHAVLMRSLFGKTM